MMDAIAAASLGTIDDFKIEELATTAWAFAKLQCLNNKLIHAISAASMSRLQDKQLDALPAGMIF